MNIKGNKPLKVFISAWERSCGINVEWHEMQKAYRRRLRNPAIKKGILE